MSAHKHVAPPDVKVFALGVGAGVVFGVSGSMRDLLWTYKAWMIERRTHRYFSRPVTFQLPTVGSPLPLKFDD